MKRVWIGLILCFLIAASCAAAENRVVAASGEHALLLDSSGNVWGWGSNGRGETSPDVKEEAVLKPTPVMANCVSVAAGRQFSMALNEKGVLYAWGDNSGGQIPGCDGTRAEGFVAVMENVACMDACEDEAVAVNTEGELYKWGGGMGIAFVMGGVKKAASGDGFVLILTDAGDMYYAGADSETPLLLMNGVADIDADGQTLMALGADGTLYAWGANGTDGRLGLAGAGEWVTSPTPLPVKNAAPAAGLSCSAALSDGKLYCWGSLYSMAGVYDADGLREGAYVERVLLNYGDTPVEMYHNVEAVAVGEAFMLIAYRDGAVYAWGSNGQGQIGDGGRTVLFSDAEEEDGDDDGEYVFTDNQQRVFPAYVMNRTEDAALAK